MFGWQTSPLDILKFFIQRNTRLYLFISVFLGRYHRNVVGRPDKRCSRVFLWMKNFNIPKKKEPLKGVVSEGSTPRTPCLLNSLNPPVCTCFEGWNVWERYLLYAWDIRLEVEFECYWHLFDLKEKEKVLKLTKKLILTFGMVPREGLYSHWSCRTQRDTDHNCWLSLDLTLITFSQNGRRVEG